MRCEGNGLPCHQQALVDPPLRTYHHKLSVGLLADSRGRWHAEPRERPKILVNDDGWAPADADVFEWLAALPSWEPI